MLMWKYYNSSSHVPLAKGFSRLTRFLHNCEICSVTDLKSYPRTGGQVPTTCHILMKCISAVSFGKAAFL